jgi:hypothetical protein
MLYPLEKPIFLKKECLDFLKTWSWKESNKSVFRVNTPEGYEALNLESNGKNKYNIILYSFFKSARCLLLSWAITSTVSKIKF